MSLQAQFAANMTRMFPSGAPVSAAIALTGGVDSMALVSLLKDYGIRIKALTVDIGHKEDSHKEAAQVHEMLESEGIEHHILPVGARRDVPQVAHELRYRALMSECEKLGCNYIFMGHNRDDMLETLMKRLHENESMFNMRAMKPLSTYPVLSPDLAQLFIARPLLTASKADILEYCKDKDVPWFEEPTSLMLELTKKNHLYRDLLNSDGTPKVLQKQALQDSLEKVEYWNTKMDQDVKAIDSQVKWSIDPTTLSFSSLISNETLKDYGVLPLTRWLFLRLYQLSPTAGYTEKFTTFDNKYSSVSLIPEGDPHSLVEDIVTGKKPSEFELLGLKFQFKTGPDGLSLTAFRAPSTDLTGFPVVDVRIKSGESPWVLFDNRVYIKLTGADALYRVENYSIVHKEGVVRSLESRPDLNASEILEKLQYNIPVLLTEDDQVAGIPTLGISFSDCNMEVKLKDSLLEKSV